MARMKRFVKVLLAGLLYYSGILRLYRGMMNRLHPGRTLILVYHSVVAGDEPRSVRDRASGLAVGVADFERQMEYLDQNYTIVPLDRLVAALRGGQPPPENACALTFDDGLEDNHRNAFPILRRLGLPASFFVPTALVGTDRVPWNMEMADLVERLPGSDFRADRLARESCPAEIAEILDQLAAGSGDLPRLLEAVKKLPAERIEALLVAMREALQVPPGAMGRAVVSWDEVRAMVAGGMSFGGHTQNHVILTRESEKTVEREIVGSLADLEAKLGRGLAGFAYPNGAFDPYAKRVVEQAGYQFACSMEECAADLRSDRYALPRRDINVLKSTGLSGRFSPAMFETTIQGILSSRRGRRSGRSREGLHSADEKCAASDP